MPPMRGGARCTTCVHRELLPVGAFPELTDNATLTNPQQRFAKIGARRHWGRSATDCVDSPLRNLSEEP